MLPRAAVREIVIKASNTWAGENPPFSIADFSEAYAALANQLPEAILQDFVDLANASLSSKRWGKAWKVAMRLFIAHFATIYLRALLPKDASTQQVLGAGELRGLVSTKTVGPVTKSYDYSTAISDLDGWADWKLTEYGVQLASMAKRKRMGGMVVR